MNNFTLFVVSGLSSWIFSLNTESAPGSSSRPSSSGFPSALQKNGSFLFETNPQESRIVQLEVPCKPQSCEPFQKRSVLIFQNWSKVFLILRVFFSEDRNHDGICCHFNFCRFIGYIDFDSYTHFVARNHNCLLYLKTVYAGASEFSEHVWNCLWSFSSMYFDFMLVPDRCRNVFDTQFIH